MLNPGDGFKAYTVIVDTNMLLDIPHINTLDWGLAGIQILILENVLDELRGLRQHENEETANRARQAYAHLSGIQQRMPAEGTLQIVPPPSEVPPPLDAEDVDHQQIALAHNWRQAEAGRFCVLLTRDWQMATIARLLRPPLPVVRPPFRKTEEQIQKQLRELIRWGSVLSRLEDTVRPAPAEMPVATEPERPPRPTVEALVRKRARSLYRLVESAGQRAVLALAPLEIRLALTAEVVARLEEEQVLFLFVPTGRDAEWWAGELYRRTALEKGTICVFGRDPLPNPGRTRVLIYHHNQVERRLDQHVSRFNQAGKEILPVVDGCELLDPVAVALLLFDLDKFIGYTQHPFDHAQAISGRILGAFFQQQTIATYTFADADQEGWLHGFDFLPHPVRLTDYEQEEYDTIREQFISLQQQIGRQFPAVKRSADFWQALNHLLAQHVHEEAAELFTLRERLENVAQDTPAKLEVVLNLLAQSGQPAHCLFLDADHEEWWTRTLTNTLPDEGYEVAVVRKGATEAMWEESWRIFERGKIDCLVVQEVPPAGLVKASLARLILPSPLAPLTVLSRMTDWALAHALPSCATPCRARR